MRKFLIIVSTLAILPRFGYAEQAQWPALRGPNLNGLVDQGNPPVKWSENENIRWKTAIPGTGHASPILWGEYLYVQTAVESSAGGLFSDPTYQFKLLAVHRNTGEIAWEKIARQAPPVEESHHKTASFASNSGIADGQYLYAFFGSQGLYCFDLEGNLKWEKDLGDMTTRNSFGEGSSPAIQGDVLVVNWDHEGDSFIVALDKRSGKELWRQQRDEPTSWSTPLVVEFDGVHQVIVSASGKTRSYDLKTGEVIWQCAGLGTNVIPTPIYRDGVVYVASGHRSPAMQAIKLAGAKGDITGTAAVLWSIDQNTPYVASPLLYGDRLFMTKNRNAILSCYDPATGNMVYGPQRLEGMGPIYSPLVGVQGRIYISDLDGSTLVVKNSAKFEVLAKNVLDEGTGASLVVAGDVIYLRGDQHLYCIAAD
ncbi:MAG: PQQ-binding-like beta-propeller repeat protein [Candidatus Latescibacteria bacterium]|nr:PQQ-binding-like beta-propeller repeat protein [Candidatus Latescibacterota bacterium]